MLLSDREAEHIPGCNMAFRREALEAIGGFDPQFRVAGDDVDICWRLQDAGHRLGFSPAAVVWHRRRDSVRAYWRQQRGYGAAEALLERKWPDRYSAGRPRALGGPPLRARARRRRSGARACTTGRGAPSPSRRSTDRHAELLSSLAARPGVALRSVALARGAVGGRHLVAAAARARVPLLVAALLVSLLPGRARRGALVRSCTSACRAGAASRCGR